MTPADFTPWVPLIADTLVASLWQSSLLALGLMILLRFLPSRHAGLRHNLALLTLAAMTLLPLATAWTAASVLGPAAATLGGSPEVEAVAVTAAATSTARPVATSAAMTVDAVGTMGSSGTPASKLAAEVAWWRPSNIVFAWLVGVFLCGLVQLVAWRRVQRLRRQATGAVPEAWQLRFDALKQQLGVNRAVRLAASKAIEVPMVIGCVKPWVVVPLSAFHGMAPQQLEAILAHELAHVRRHDLWVNLFQVLAESVFFFHPAIWWASGEVRRSREYCCDDLAVTACGDRRLYAVALAQLEGMRSPALALAADGGSLVGRIRRLAGVEEVRSPAKAWLAAALLVASTAAGWSLIHVTDVDAQPKASLHSSASSDRYLGTWTAEPAGQRMQLKMSFSDGMQSWTTVDRQQLSDVSTGRAGGFRWTRDAGSLIFTGMLDASGQGSGTVRFEADSSFASTVSSLGYGDLSTQGSFEMTIHNVDRAFVGGLHDLGYSELNLKDLVALRIHDAGPEMIRALAAEGLEGLSKKELLACAIHDVTPEFVRGMREAGFADLAAEDLVEFAIHDVTPEVVAAWRANGMEGLDARKLVEFAIHDLTPESLWQYRDVGLDDLEPRRLIELAIHDLTPERVQEYRDLGFTDSPATRLIEFAIHDIDAEFVRGLEAVGYTELPARRLIEFAIHDVTPQVIRELRGQGYADLPADRLVEFQIHDIDPAFIQEVRANGELFPSPERLVEIAIQGSC